MGCLCTCGAVPGGDGALGAWAAGLGGDGALGETSDLEDLADLVDATLEATVRVDGDDASVVAVLMVWPGEMAGFMSLRTASSLDTLAAGSAWRPGNWLLRYCRT